MLWAKLLFEFFTVLPKYFFENFRPDDDRDAKSLSALWFLVEKKTFSHAIDRSYKYFDKARKVTFSSQKGAVWHFLRLSLLLSALTFCINRCQEWSNNCVHDQKLRTTEGRQTLLAIVCWHRSVRRSSERGGRKVSCAAVDAETMPTHRLPLPAWLRPVCLRESTIVSPWLRHLFGARTAPGGFSFHTCLTRCLGHLPAQRGPYENGSSFCIDNAVAAG